MGDEQEKHQINLKILTKKLKKITQVKNTTWQRKYKNRNPRVLRKQ